MHLRQSHQGDDHNQRHNYKKIVHMLHIAEFAYEKTFFSFCIHLSFFGRLNIDRHLLQHSRNGVGDGGTLDTFSQAMTLREIGG